MSTIFADKFKNTSGGNPVQINQLRGIDTAGSITIQGEGTATTNLQQGLCKVWHHGSQDGVDLQDSFNVSSMADTATGRQTVNMTNNMNNDDYAVQNAIHNGQTRFTFIESLATSSYISNAYNVANNAYQDAHQNSKVHGDLA